jgi:5-formyltetrahydrofolate cyclo-ligase
MHTPIREAKKAIRHQALEQLKLVPAAQRAAGSAQACALLRQQTLWKEACSVLFFAPMPGELDVWPLLLEGLAAGKLAALPRYVPEDESYIACQVQDPARDVKAGYFGIREPVPRCAELRVNRLDLILVPGVAFDPHGRRLGRGKGFYDQLLAVVSGTTCGVAFDEQIVAEVPVEPHDARLNCLLTPTRWIEV